MRDLKRNSLRPQIGLLLCLSAILFCSLPAHARNNVSESIYQKSTESPLLDTEFRLLRAEEDYSWLLEEDRSDWRLIDSIKSISLNRAKQSFVSLGGEIRPRYELYNNRFWTDERDESFYSQRISLHANLVLNEKIRTFVELFHGYTSHKREIAEYDPLDIHQAFFEYTWESKPNDSLTLRVGRQELALGAARLIGIREGPNIRRSFDMVQLVKNSSNLKLQAFYGNEVGLGFSTFDNESGIFSTSQNNPTLWGLYSRFSLPTITGNNDVYLLGFKNPNSTYNETTGKELRHTFGLRRHGKLGERFSYNTELVYQFGQVGDSKISAFNLEGDWQYQIKEMPFRPKVGLKIDWASGDSRIGDTKINTYNSMFVNPEYYSLSKVITPINIFSIHPSVTLSLSDKSTLYIEYATFDRESRKDGLYRVPRFISRGVEEKNKFDKKVGDQIGLKFTHKFNKHWKLTVDFSYFRAGKFLKETGEGENIIHFAPTLRYVF